MELIGASWIIFIKYTSYILSKLEKLKYLENLPVFFKILLVGYCIHVNSLKSANKIVQYLIFYSTPWFGQCVRDCKNGKLKVNDPYAHWDDIGNTECERVGKQFFIPSFSIPYGFVAPLTKRIHKVSHLRVFLEDQWLLAE